MNPVVQWFAVFGSRVPDPLLLLDPAGVVLGANAAVGGWFTLPVSELTGRRLSELVATPPEDLERQLWVWSATTSPVPGSFIVRDGRESRRVRCHGARLPTADGCAAVLVRMARPPEVDRFAVLTQQITLLNREIAERKHVEAQREALLEDLSETVRLAEMLMAILGHDLRNPLGAIVTAAHLARVRSGDPQIHGYADRIQRSAARMSRLINQLLDVTRLRLGRGMRVDASPTDLGAIVEHVVAEVTTAHPERHVLTEVDGDALGSWDRDRLAQVVANLISNAFEHGAPASPVRITVDGSTSGGVALHVSNQGPPISPDRLPRLFEPFEQGDGSRGFGLGLYIAREIARAHHGDISVTSESGVTVFTLHIPRSADAPEDQRSTSSAASMSRSAASAPLAIDR
ncbi:MAG TPA: ATP-binding protein [Anaeromyxobacteraceae bacterium]|nr:ATP-binding protein [Anaeromyxobacteraceae bacterium]